MEGKCRSWKILRFLTATGIPHAETREMKSADIVVERSIQDERWA